MRDARARRVLKGVALANYRLGLAVTRLSRRLRGERPHRLAGACRRSGCCCEAPAVGVGPAVWYVPSLRRAFLWWQERVNGFVPTGQDSRSRAFVFRCTHFDPESRSCDSYETRPGMCRDYPRLQLYEPHPAFLPGCGFRAVAPNAAGLLAELRRRRVSDAQLARLTKDLNLEPGEHEEDPRETAPRSLPAARPAGERLPD